MGDRCDRCTWMVWQELDDKYLDDLHGVTPVPFYEQKWRYDHIVGKGRALTNLEEIAFMYAYCTYLGLDCPLEPMYAKDILECTLEDINVQWWALYCTVGTFYSETYSMVLETTLDLKILRYLESTLDQLHEPTRDEATIALATLDDLMD